MIKGGVGAAAGASADEMAAIGAAGEGSADVGSGGDGGSGGVGDAMWRRIFSRRASWRSMRTCRAPRAATEGPAPAAREGSAAAGGEVDAMYAQWLNGLPSRSAVDSA